jgi:16S rRNA (uracil1498-N3)-methyltransferase
VRHIPHVLAVGPWTGPSIELAPDRHQHLVRVLRLDDGAEVHYTDGSGTIGSGVLAGGSIERGDERTLAPEPDLHVVCSPPKSKDRVRFLVEKVAEAGATSLRWLRTERTEGRPPRPDRSRAWADAALEQSRGAWRLSIGTTSWDELAEEPFLVGAPEGRPFGPGDLPCTVVIGPEGGLAPTEVPNRGEAVTFGGRILRTETAAMAAVVLARRSRPG